jgi:hypothetical protein
VRLCVPGHLPRCRRTPAHPAAHGSCHTPSASCTGSAFAGVLCSHDKSKSHASPQGSSGEGCQRPHADPLARRGQRTLPLAEPLTRGNPSHNETLNASGFVAACKGRDTGHNHPSCHLAHTCGDSAGLACPPRASQAQAQPLQRAPTVCRLHGKPLYALCERETVPPQAPPPVPPTPMPSTHRHPREVETWPGYAIRQCGNKRILF